MLYYREKFRKKKKKKTQLFICLLALLGSQGIVVKWTAAIFFPTEQKLTRNPWQKDHATTNYIGDIQPVFDLALRHEKRAGFLF